MSVEIIQFEGQNIFQKDKKKTQTCPRPWQNSNRHVIAVTEGEERVKKNYLHK